MKERRKARMLSYLLLALLVGFTLASIVVGSILKAYATFWWWDDMLHTISGMLMGFVGLVLLYPLHPKRSLNSSPLFIALFIFCFSLSIATVWEFFEFSMDYFFGTAMQQWNMPPGAIVIGKSYQGMGLRDTMSDLIHSFIGAIAVAIFAYFAWKRHQKLVIEIGKQAFPWVKK